MHPRLREEGTSCRFTLVKSKSASSTPSTAQARFHGLQPISYCTDPSSSFRSWPVPKDLLDPTQNPTSSSLPKLLYNASMSSPAKESEPANINVSAISKSSASNGNLLQSHRGGNNSPEKKKIPSSVLHYASLRDWGKLQRRCSFSQTKVPYNLTKTGSADNGITTVIHLIEKHESSS